MVSAMIGGASMSNAAVCTLCRERPRVGTLSRCADCIRATAEVDRQNAKPPNLAWQRESAPKMQQKRGPMPSSPGMPSYSRTSASTLRRYNTATNSCCNPGTMRPTYKP